MKIIELKDVELIHFLHGVAQYSPIINDGNPDGKNLRIILDLSVERYKITGDIFCQIEDRYFSIIISALDLVHRAYSDMPINDRVVSNVDGTDLTAAYWSLMLPKIEMLKSSIQQLTSQSKIIH
jgi:hypothetical protein